MKRLLTLLLLALAFGPPAWAVCLAPNADEFAAVVAVDDGECKIFRAKGYRLFVVETRSDSASQVLTFTDNALDAETFTIGATVYTAEDGTVDAGEFALGADAEETIANLCALITSDHDDATCSASDATTLTVTARIAGSHANTMATTTTSMTAAWTGATLEDVTDAMCTSSWVDSVSATEHTDITTQTTTDTNGDRDVFDVEGLFGMVTCTDGDGGVVTLIR